MERVGYNVPVLRWWRKQVLSGARLESAMRYVSASDPESLSITASFDTLHDTDAVYQYGGMASYASL
jgi:hypothetical protein